MTDHDQQTPKPADAALELNKETLQDLDLEPVDPDNVKGGAMGNTAGCTGPCAKPGVQMTLACATYSGSQMTSAVGSMNAVHSA